MVRDWSFCAILFVSALTMGGCAAPAPQKGADSAVKRVGILYMRFVGSHAGKTPADREEFEGYLGQLSEADMKAIGIEKIQDLFYSARDNSELVIRYGITIPPPQPGNPTVVAYEAKGSGGRRLVAFANAGVEEVASDRFKELVPDAK